MVGAFILALLASDDNSSSSTTTNQIQKPGRQERLGIMQHLNVAF
jgi:hypothetical protein